MDQTSELFETTDTEDAYEMVSPIRTITEAMQSFLEDFDPESTDDDILSSPVHGAVNPQSSILGDDKLLGELNALETPIIIQNAMNTEIIDQIHEACSGENVLLENNIIKFDKETQKAQLISLCALLIARQSNSPDYQAYKQASNVRKSMKLKIQRDNAAAASALADKYLRHMAATSNNSIVRQAAEQLDQVTSGSGGAMV